MVPVTLRLSDEVHKAIKASAEQNIRSLNGEITLAIMYYLENSPDAKPKMADEETKSEES